MSTTPATFKEAYDKLKQNADKLQSSTEPNIDELLEIVNESTAAYNVCRERIAAVEQALNQTLKAATKTATADNVAGKEEEDV